jgi:hypothetical protein
VVHWVEPRLKSVSHAITIPIIDTKGACCRKTLAVISGLAVLEL